MKLHLPARLRSALLACLAVVAPLAGTVATGTFVGGAVVASLSLTEAQAAEVEVAVDTTVTYDEADTYVLKGGTLNVESGVVSSAITVGAPDSTISLGAGAVLSPLRVTLAEGVDSYKLVGTGTYDLASATQMYGANASTADWTGTVSISNSVGVGAFNINNYGNASSSVKLSGVAGWLALGVAFNPTLILEDTPDASALNQTDGSSGREYAFAGVKGTGTFERGGTKFSGAVSYAFTGDVSDWTGYFVNNFGQTTLVFRGNASEINLAGITHNAGYDMGVKFDGAVATTVNSPIQSTAGGAINMTINNTGGVTFNRLVGVTTLTTNAPMTVGSTGNVTVSGAATIGGALTVNGSLSLNAGATLGASVSNAGTLNISGDLVVQSAGLERTPTGDTTFSDGVNGVITKGSLAYTVINNAEGAKLNLQGVNLSFDGDTSLQLTSAGTVIREADTSSNLYWVNVGNVSLADTDAAAYRMNKGTLVLDKTDAAAQGAALVSVEGGKGIVQIVADTTLTGQQVSQATCGLIVSGATLKLGTGEAQDANIASFSSVTLEDNAALFIESKSSVINNLTVNETGARFDIKDTQGVPSSNPYRFSGVTTLNGTLTRVVNGGWGNGVMFDCLTGAGSLVYTNNPNEQSYIAINSLQGFTGDLSFTQTNNNAGLYEVVIKSGASAVSMDTITVGCINKKADFRNMSVSLDAANGLTLKQLQINTNTDLNVTGAAGLSVSDEVRVMGSDNRISVLGDTALNLSTLNVQADASLTLVGRYSALAMNQAGEVTMTDMRLEDGASLVYGADADTLLITAENLLGSVKVDLNSLTNAQSLALVTGADLDLGIDAAVDKSLISVVADNVRNVQLKKVDDRWSIDSSVVSLFWEAAGDGTWDSSANNWAFRDEEEPVTKYHKGSDAIFSGDDGAVVTITDSVDVENIDVRSGKYTFAADYDGKLSVKNNLIIAQNAEATFNKASASANELAVAGNVTVGKDAVLSVNLDSMSVAGKLSGAGKVNVDSDLLLGASSSVGQLKVTGDIKMTGSTRELTVGGASSAASLSNVSKLTVNKGGVMSVASDTSLGSLAGEGQLNVADLTLSSGASSIASLNADSVTLQRDVTLDVDALQTAEVKMIMGAKVVNGTPLLTVDKTVGDMEVALAVEKVDDLAKLTNGSVITIASIGTPGGDITGALQAPVDPSVTVIDPENPADPSTSFSVTKNLRGFGYTLVVSDDNTAVTLVTGRDNRGWIGTSSDSWTQGELTGWQTGFIPNPVDRAAGFFGNGSSVVNVDEAGVKTALVDVDVAVNLLDKRPSYTFVGGSVETGSMYIGQGELIIANETFVDKDTKVYTNGKLTIAENGRMEAYGNFSLEDAVSLSLESGARLTVSGTLSAEKDVTITNSGMLLADKVEVAGTIANEGTLQIGEGGSVGAIEGGIVRAMLSAPGTLELGSANVSVLQIGTTGSTVKLSGDSVIGTLYSTVEGTTLTSSAKLTLTETVSNQGGAVNVSAKSLTLNKIGNEFNILNAPVITLALQDSVLSAEDAAITVESILTPEPVQIVLTQEVIEGLPVDGDNLIVADDYLLISGVSGHKVTDFSIADDIMQEIRRRGVTADTRVLGDNLVLSLGAIEGGMSWDTSSATTDNGYEIPVGEGFYRALDYVEEVQVSANKTIDLTAAGVGNAVAGNATVPAAGLMVRNPNGSGQLTLLGDAAGADGELPDVVTIISNREPETPIALAVESVKVNLGLPEGVEGILGSDEDAGAVVLASAEMTKAAVLLVNSGAVVKGQVKLADAASLVVAEGKSMALHQLNGDASATVTGTLDVIGVGGSYEGSYGKSGAQVNLREGAYQSMLAGSGLSLYVAGGEGTLELGGADAEMELLSVGAAARATGGSRSELIINNAIQNDDAGKVEHYTVSLKGDGSRIVNSEVTASLGAEETAVTLGSDKAPVILDGKVDVSASTICLTMVTTSDNLRSLDVNTDAPMVGAKLATLATGGVVSADNEVELMGSRAMMNVINKYYTNARLDASGNVLVDRVTDYYADKATGLSETGNVGVGMLDKVLVHLNPQARVQEYTDLAAVLNALDDAVVAGNTAAADRLASAVTGASAAAMGAALAGDMERQLRAIRNRTTTMGVDQGTVNHNMPYFNAWINAEYDNRQLDSDGTLSGYEYSVTGGTVGFDVDITPRFVCGLAVSALTGDVSSDGSDNLEADVDSYYLSAFARTTYRRWTHTFVASLGKSDLSIDRTVSFSGGSYRTAGETDAMSFGAMYELGYVFALDVDGTTCLQPVFNVSVAHSSMDGYTETDSDAALDVGSVDMTTITVGMGARLQSVVGQNVFNRSAIFESRALVKVNAGDRDAEVDTSLVSLPTAGGKVASAERGPVSLELGAGITIPVGAQSGSIFVDGSAELGSEYTGLNATVGYRLNF